MHRLLFLVLATLSPCHAAADDQPKQLFTNQERRLAAAGLMLADDKAVLQAALDKLKQAAS